MENLGVDLLDQLIGGLGDIIRGCKKLKKCAEALKTNFQPTSSEDTESSDSTVNQPRQAQTSEKTICEEDLQAKTEIYFQNKPFVGRASFKRFLETTCEDNVRQDKQKNTWVYNCKFPKSERKAWRKISQNQAEDLYKNIKEAWELLQEKFRGDRPKHIKESKWSRRSNITEFTMQPTLWSNTVVRAYFNDVHHKYGPLRG